MLKEKRVLLVGAHPDDIEVMCGGTLAKYRDETEQVRSIIFAPCLEDPLNEGIINEYQNAMGSVGVYESIHHKFPRDILEDHAQDVRNLLHDLKGSFNPEVIISPSVNDLHQDHRAVAMACRTIFRDSATVISGEIMRSTIHFMPNLYVALNYKQMIEKLRLLKHYKTQARRTYFTSEIVESIARFRGCQASTPYAEAFEVWRMIDT